MPYMAIKLLLEGKKAIKYFQPHFGIKSSYLEKEIVLKENAFYTKIANL